MGQQIGALGAYNIEFSGPGTARIIAVVAVPMTGLQTLSARDANARNLADVLTPTPRRPVHDGAIPASNQVPGPATDAAAVCSAASVQSVSPAPVQAGAAPASAATVPVSGVPSGAGMVNFGRQYRERQHKQR